MVSSLLKALVMPSSVAVIAIVTGVSILFVERFKRFSLPLLVFAGATIVLFSTGNVAGLLLSPLEYAYPYVKDPKEFPAAKKIVILTGYGADDPLVPLSSKLNSASTFRVLEGQRLFASCVECEIVITGNKPVVSLMRAVLESMGIPKNKIREDGESAHTYVSAQNLGPWLQKETFFLVTSAGHMPRAMGVFRKQGLNPIPAPTDYQLPKDFLGAEFSPSPQHLYFSDLAVREYAGIAWYKLTGKL